MNLCVGKSVAVRKTRTLLDEAARKRGKVRSTVEGEMKRATKTRIFLPVRRGQIKSPEKGKKEREGVWRRAAATSTSVTYYFREKI